LLVWKATVGLARKSADGLLPIRDFVDWREDKVDQILTDSGLECGVLFREFFFCVKVVFAVIS